jgi:hypothetical protein
MAEEVLTVVRLPLADLVDEVRRKHRLTETLADVRVERDALVMYFSRTQPPSPPDSSVAVVAKSEGREPATLPGHMEEKRRRRARGTRNRMKTRGWQVIGRFINSRGQTAIIYKPFVDALKGKRMTTTQQRAIVAQILRANGNRPSAGSIQYYWMNTIEYLQRPLSKEEALVNAN